MMAAPLTPADCDLTDFQRMMIDIPRLRGSNFDATLDDGAWRAGLNLWLTSWHQVPAASLPDDDVALTKAAGLGRDIKTWRKVKAEALRGWVKCDDGLLYHETVAEFALEAWLEKLAQTLSSGAGNAKRWKTDFDPAPIEAEIDRTADMLSALNPKSKALVKLERRRARTPIESDPDGNAVGTKKPSQQHAKIIPSGSLGTGTGTLREEGSDEPSLSADKPARARASRRLPETRLPEGYPDLQAQAEAVAWVAEAGVILDIGAQARRFRDHATTNDRLARDWPSAWRQWIGIASEEAPKAAPRPTPIAAADWPGPREIWDAVVRATSEGFAQSYLLDSAWLDLPRPTIVSPSPTAISKLRPIVTPMGIELQERAA